MIRQAFVVVLVVALTGSPTLADAELIGHWTFENDSLADSQGNFPDLALKGSAAVGGGQLDVNFGGWAVTQGGSYSGPTITNKTLVSWVSMQTLGGNSGSAITIDRLTGDHFDGIIFGERQPNRWMNGSSNFSRTDDFAPGFAETTTDTLVQIAITYEHLGLGQMEVTGYRDGVLIGQYTTSNASSWTAGDAEIFFGLRHGSIGGGPGEIDALIEEARIYGQVLTGEELAALQLGATHVPEPTSIALWGIGLLGMGIVAARRHRRKQA